VCGIIGYLGPDRVVPVLVEGLRRLEYRGYDSAGIAVVSDDGIEVRRSPGKLSRLEQALKDDPVEGRYGLGHTRWATHGRPTEENAHPHRDCTGRLVVVHNGIIENYLALKRELEQQGHRFVTETDTEIIAHLVEREMRGDGLAAAVRRALAGVGSVTPAFEGVIGAVSFDAVGDVPNQNVYIGLVHRGRIEVENQATAVAEAP